VRELLDAVRPHPHRGDLIAAAAVPLAIGVLLAEVRFDGVAGVALAATLLAALVISTFGPLGDFTRPALNAGTGWELVLLALGLALVAYAGVDREPGPGYLGFVVLVLFVVLAGQPSEDGASLIGWPILLLFLGGAGVAAGLRPRRDLPPEPAPRVAPAPPSPMSAHAAEAPTEVRPAEEREDPSEPK
jgi:hypothetical protein